MVSLLVAIEEVEEVEEVETVMICVWLIGGGGGGEEAIEPLKWSSPQYHVTTAHEWFSGLN